MRLSSTVMSILCQGQERSHLKEYKRHVVTRRRMSYCEVICERIYHYLGYLPSVFSEYSLSSMASFLVLPICVKLRLSTYLFPCSMSKMRCAAIRNKTQSPANKRSIEPTLRKLLKDIVLLSVSSFHNADCCYKR